MILRSPKVLAPYIYGISHSESFIGMKQLFHLEETTVHYRENYYGS